MGVISRILYLDINLSRPFVTKKLKLGIFLSYDRGINKIKIPFPLHLIQFTKNFFKFFIYRNTESHKNKSCSNLVVHKMTFHLLKVTFLV